MNQDRDNVIQLQRRAGGVAAGIRTSLYAGRTEIVTVGPNAEFAFIKSDPYGTNVGTGLVVPSVPSALLPHPSRYLFQLARASFQAGEVGVRLVGIRLYTELVARIPQEGAPNALFRQPIQQPLWHPPDGDISLHVMVNNRVSRDMRHPANGDGFAFQDATAPALLFQTPFPDYTPPNGGRPWGTPLAASLGNIHELRYAWRDQNSEYALDVPIPLPCDLALVASVRQNNPATNPSDAGLSFNQFQALSAEDQFLTAFSAFAQYGVIAGALVFDNNLGKDVP